MVAAKPLTLDYVVDKWRHADRQTLPILMFLGGLADRYVREQPDRAEAIRQLKVVLREQGLPNDVNRTIACYWVGKVFGLQNAQMQWLGTSALRLFVRLIKRDPRSDQWHLRPKTAAAAKELWNGVLAHGWTAKKVRQELARVLPQRKSPQAVAKKTPAGEIFAQMRRDLPSLENAQLEELIKLAGLELQQKRLPKAA